MITRREAVRLLCSASTGAWYTATQTGLNFVLSQKAVARKVDSTPRLAPGAPKSPERLALIDAFLKRSEGLQNKFEARKYKSDWAMPYRLFHPGTTRKVPLVLYLHGSGGLGDDNLKQLSLGNRFGTRVWLLPENQKRFPCCVLAPQTDRGWIRYDFSQQPAKELQGFGDGARLALEIVDGLRREFHIDERRIYIAGNSMGGAGVWNVLAHRPSFFAAAVICCGGESPDDGTGSAGTPLWIFTEMPTKSFPCLHRVTALRRDGGLAEIRSTPSTPEWITMAQTDWLSLNRSCRSGCSLNVVGSWTDETARETGK